MVARYDAIHCVLGFYIGSDVVSGLAKCIFKHINFITKPYKIVHMSRQPAKHSVLYRIDSRERYMKQNSITRRTRRDKQPKARTKKS